MMKWAYLGLGYLLVLTLVVMENDSNKTPVQVEQKYLEFSNNGKKLINAESFEYLEICSLTVEKPYYDCNEKWNIYYSNNVKSIYHVGSGSVYGGTAMYNGTTTSGFPITPTVIVTHYNEYDSCGMTILEHELRHLKDHDWVHEERCFLGSNYDIRYGLKVTFLVEIEDGINSSEELD